MSRTGRGKGPVEERTYWGCTTLGGCDTAEAFTDFPRDVTHCPECDGELRLITARPKPEPNPPAAAVPPELQAQLERHARMERVFMACKVAIIKDSPPLWPPDIVGASIAEQWMQNLARHMAAARTRVSAEAAGIALPS